MNMEQSNTGKTGVMFEAVDIYCKAKLAQVKAVRFHEKVGKLVENLTDEEMAEYVKRTMEFDRDVLPHLEVK